jgi:fatty aldehyde decarbonylase
MATLEATDLPTAGASLPDFTCANYKDAYSRINAIVTKLARMEMKHMKGFTACANNLGVTADMAFAKEFFAPLHGNFQKALAEGKVPTCLLIQALLIEAFAISAYHIYIPVADPFARKITEGVVKDEYTHLNYGEVWLKANLENCREELEEANRENLPLIRRMLDQVAGDAAVLHMDKEDLIEDFLIAYQEALTEIGFSTREIARMAAAALVG